MSSQAAFSPRRPLAGQAGARASWTPAAVLALFQGLYFFATGLWPLVSIETFQMVTGPKTDNWTGREADHWLVMTVGVLVLVIGLVLLVAGWRRHLSAEVVLLAVGSAIGLTVIDVLYVAREVIPPSTWRTRGPRWC